MRRRIRRVSKEPIKIAVIGMSCRLPGGVESPAEFWELLSERRDVVQDTPPPRGVLFCPENVR